MKKLILACALLGGISAYAQAHDHDRQPPSAEARTAQLQKVLQLSDDQAAKVKKVFEADAQQHKALADKYKPQFEAFRADMKKQRDQTHEQLKAVLTPKQQQALEALHDARGKHHPGAGWGHGDAEHDAHK